MEEDDSRHELTLTLHGLDEYNREVDAEVFARKLATLLKGVRLSDAAVNGRRRHKLLITALSKNTASASFREHVFNSGPPAGSGLSFFENAIESVSSGLPRAKEIAAPILREIASLNNGVGRSFRFGELKSTSGNVIRIDHVLAEKAAMLTGQVAAVAAARSNRFSGVSFSYFEGVLKLIDLRGDVWKGLLVLSAGGRPIECSVNSLSDEQLGQVLNKRVAAYGKAYYDGRSGLPSRLEITTAKALPGKEGADLSRWRGRFDFGDRDPAEEWH